MGEHDVLIADLRTLGRTVQAAPDAAERICLAVAANLPGDGAGACEVGTVGEHLSGWWGTPRRRLAVVVLAVAGLLLAPPVRAAVAEWFGFAGVKIHAVPAGPTGTPGPPPTLTGSTDLGRAHALISFAPLVPTELGLPQGVEVSPDRRVLSMTWSSPSGPIRLDQFADQLDYAFAKTAADAEDVSVGPDFGMWFPRPHEVVVLAADGTPRTRTARLAGHTLIWDHNGTALRLEGDLTRERAVEIGRSIQPVLGASVSPSVSRSASPSPAG